MSQRQRYDFSILYCYEYPELKLGAQDLSLALSRFGQGTNFNYVQFLNCLEFHRDRYVTTLFIIGANMLRHIAMLSTESLPFQRPSTPTTPRPSTPSSPRFPMPLNGLASPKPPTAPPTPPQTDRSATASPRQRPASARMLKITEFCSVIIIIILSSNRSDF